MSRTTYSEIHLHITWHVKEGRPLLEDAAERVAHAAIRRKAMETRGVIVHAVNGTPTHVHVALQVPPSVLVSELIGQMKGASSFAVNESGPTQERFAWQIGYGVVSFGTRNLEWVVDYVNKQKQHHAAGTTVDRLERTESEVAEPV
jgi:putative transposase